MKRKPIKEEEMQKQNDTENVDEAEMEAQKEEETEKCSTKKSEDITEDDLLKSIQQLEDYAKADDPDNRKNELLEKAQTTDLTDDEKVELFKALGGDSDGDDYEDESITKGFEENEEIQKSLDVSEFLTEQHIELVKALSSVEDTMNKSDNRQHEFNLMLAKSVALVGKLTKALGDRIENIENQPVRKPTSVKPLQKSFAGKTDDNNMSKSEILNQMMKKAENGEGDVNMWAHAIAKYESTNQIDPRLLAQLSTKDSTVN